MGQVGARARDRDCWPSARAHGFLRPENAKGRRILQPALAWRCSRLQPAAQEGVKLAVGQVIEGLIVVGAPLRRNRHSTRGAADG